MGNIVEKTKHQLAYRCESGHFIPRNKSFAHISIDSIEFYGCCPECGSRKVSEVTGIWQREYAVINNLFGKKKKLIKEQFLESILSEHERRMGKQ